MMTVPWDSVTDAIGDTPLIQVDDYPPRYVKAEMYNPSGSVKDRVAVTAINKAKQEDKEGIVEPTSGNTGIGIAMCAAAEDMDAILTVPKEHSERKVRKMEAYGATVEIAEDHRTLAHEIADDEDYSLLNQYENSMVPNTHRHWTGQEIVDDIGDEITHFVASMTTGGTITGVAKKLKSHNEDIKVIGLDSKQSNLKQIFEGEDYEPTPSNIDGIGKHYESGVIDFDYIDYVKEVTKEEAKEGAKALSQEQGIFGGFSAGGVYHTLQEMDGAVGSTIAGLLPDSGNRYEELE